MPRLTEPDKWLQEYLGLFDHAGKMFKGMAQKLSLVEKAVSGARVIDAGTLKAIEEKGDAWSYMSWWPRLSGDVTQPVRISHLKENVKKQKLRGQIL